MGFLLDAPFSSPYYLGTGSSAAAAAGITDSALGSHAYMIDWKGNPPLIHQSVPLLKQQQDTRELPGENSINPEGFWLRSGESWHRGAGQRFFDRKDSDPFRFEQSRGMFIWDEWSISLLNDVDEKRATANTNLRMAVAGSFLYIIDGSELRRTADVTVGTPTFTNITGVPVNNPSSIASDGFNVVTAHGASGIYKTTRGAATTASHITGTVSIVSFVKNRFMAAQGRIIYDVSSNVVGAAVGALPAAFFTHPNTDFTWVDFAEGNAAIYAAGFSGDKSLIYRIGIQEDGTALDQPIIAGQLPHGEIVTAIYGYLGRFIMIGTDRGWRLAVAGDSGDLSIGERVDTPEAVRCFEGQGQFVWFGWTNFDATATGLGRLNLGEFVDTDLLVPAYASDLMVPNKSGDVTSIVTFQERIVFAVSGAGFYAEDTNLVASGYFDTGDITFGLIDPKLALFVDAQHLGEDGTHEILIQADDGGFVSLGTHDHDSFPRSVGQVEGRIHELRHVLYRDATDATLGLTMTSWLLLAQPKVKSVTTHIIATILIAPEVRDLKGDTLFYKPHEELAYIAGLAREKNVEVWQEGTMAYQVIVEDYQLLYSRINQGAEGLPGFNGSCLIKMKVVE